MVIQHRLHNLIFCLLLAFFATGSNANAGSDKVTSLNVVTSLSSSDPMYKGLIRFKQLVETGSKGSLSVNLFIGSQLGNDDDILEQAMAGAGIAVLVDGGRLSVYAHEMGILGAPYLVNNLAELQHLVSSDLFQQWNGNLQQNAGLRVLAFNWWQGARHLLTQRAVAQPEDLNGLRLRTISAPVWISTIEAMGATPTPLSWSEVYSALQQRVIDAGEAQLAAVWGARLYEVISHVSKTGHIQLISGLVTSDDWFNRLTVAEQDVILHAATAAGKYATSQVLTAENDIEAKLTAAGVSISTPPVEPFMQATESVYQTLGYSELRQQVRTLLDEGNGQ
ncbi:MAG: C4-dicarboxylate TRAP transporter substrate-binding protein [Alteromonas oceani]